MQIHRSLLLFFFSILSISFLFFTNIQGFEPAPAPIYAFHAESPSVRFSPPAPDSRDGNASPIAGFSPQSTESQAPVYGFNAESPSVRFSSPAPDSRDSNASPIAGFSPLSPESQAPATVEKSAGLEVTPSPAPVEEEEENAAEEEGSERVIRWCTGRDEVEECQSLVSVLKETDDYTWTCINKDTTQECLESIKNGEADLMNLEAGMAYIAFTTYSMKAIANEVYCDQAKSYDAVVLVNRKSCQEKEDISLMDFKGHKSCHGGHSTAAGWNYPINHINRFFGSEEMNDQEIATKFFSKVCAPSQFEGEGVCSGCEKENGTCALGSNNLYFGHSGAFRCLVEELGDLAFVRGDTALLYSMEGPYNQSWSKKSVRDFMYLCPKGGCREINGYPGSCSFGAVPANVIMASNSIRNKKKLLILQRLTNDTWRDALHAGKRGSSHLLSPSMQQLAAVKKLTRLYLGNSALVSQNIQKLNTPRTQVIQSVNNSDSHISASSCNQHSMVITFSSFVTMLMLMVFTRPIMQEAI
ncbi:lactotransferrin isoform X3 [Ricinus communis]|uniref:lactotransferrin isoform X3 n=1 Tax=Ricinus communis TaxID=3988 RepID=UPI00201B34AA|nr:lactotransferrin isoform X3 [Ricinus communis]